MLLFNKPTAISYISKSGDKIYPVVIDIKEGVKSSETLSFMTADSNTGILSVAFMEGETIYNIDGATVVCDIERPDGTDLSIGAVKVADGVVEVPLGVNGTSQPGVYMFDFKIIRPGSKTIGVPLVSYTVTQSINTDEIVTQDDRLPVLNDLIVKIQNATSANTQATNECNKATQDSITATNNSIQATNNVNNAMKSINNAIASGTVDLELKQVRTSLNGTLHPTANDRINQMETHLLEATATTVETESSFTTVDATSNGYFEGVKLEGKTLINLCKNVSHTILGTDNNSWSKPIYLHRCLSVGSTYTLIANVTSYSLDYGFTIMGRVGGSNGSDVQYKLLTITGSGLAINKFNADKPLDTLTIADETSTLGESVITDFILLEGDYTNNPPEFFEGLMSVGQDVEEVSVESMNENLFDISKFNLSRENLYGYQKLPTNIGSYTLKLEEIDPSVDISDIYFGFSATGIDAGGTGNANRVCWLISGGRIDFKSYTDLTYKYISIHPNKKESLTKLLRRFKITLVAGEQVNSIPHQSDKKPLLYFNPTTETWEKPILREWDTIEKHSDGKYYYHKRSGEIVLNGSESWIFDSTAIHTAVDRYLTPFPKAQGLSRLLCDNFTVLDTTNINVEGVLIGSDKSIYCNITKSKLSTQDVAGFKAWLKANPTTIVYQLAQEEVYECANIDLMTYSGETNYIINSGAISPKSLLKVHNNISNVVKILQEKVSLLETTFIAGLKSVLSGDMYSLATILYPEDFEQNDNTEQDIMVIPE